MDPRSTASSRLSAALLCAALLACLSSLPFYPFLLPQPAASRPTPGAAPAAAAPPRAVSHVVLFVMDGVGTRVAFRRGAMPRLQSRYAQTAHGVGVVSFPTTTPPGLRALVSGHRSLPDAEFPDSPRHHESDSVMSRAAAAGRKVFVVGQQDWPALFSGHGADITTIRYHEPGLDYDAGVFAAARDIASGKRGPWDFLVIHFFGTDPLAHLRGTEGPEYAERLKLNDERVDTISSLCPAGTAFLLSADHGQSPNGTHGGISRYTVYVPIVLWGAGIKAGDFGEVPQHEVAPTLAALLGVAPPVLSEGTALLSALDLTPEEKAGILERTLEQKSERWSALKQTWPWLDGDPAAALAGMRHRLAAKDWSGSSKIAEAAIASVSEEVEEASPVRWYGRYVAAETLLVVAAGLLFLWKPARLWTSAVAVLSALIAAACFVPVAFPGYWPEMSLLCLVSAAAALAYALWAGYRLPPLHWSLWAGAALGAVGLANPSLVDVSLWSVIVILVLWARRWPGPDPSRRALARWAAAGAGLGLAWIIGGGDTVTDASVLRNMLPVPGSPWSPEFYLLADAAVFAALAVAFWSSSPDAPLRRRLGNAVAALAPLVLSLAAPTGTLYYHLLCWGASLASLLLAMRTAPSASYRGLWFALCALSYELSLSRVVHPQSMLAVFVCWALLGEGAPDELPWDALALAALALWGFTFAGFSLDFSRISVSTVYALPGVHSSLILEIAAVGLRQLCALAAPVLPALSGRGASRSLPTLPLLGAISAGNLFYFWVDRMWAAKGLMNLIDDEFVARALWAGVLAWILTLWCLGAWFWNERRRPA